MHVIKKMGFALAFSVVAAFAVAEDGSDRALSGVPDARQPPHIILEQFQGEAHLRDKN